MGDSLLHELRVGRGAADGRRWIGASPVLIHLATWAASCLVSGGINGHDGAASAAEGAALGCDKLVTKTDYVVTAVSKPSIYRQISCMLGEDQAVRIECMRDILEPSAMIHCPLNVPSASKTGL